MNNKTEFCYHALRGKIVEKCGTLARFSRCIGVSNATVGNKLSGKSYFSQEQIELCCQVLDIPQEEIPKYFFCKKN